MKPPRVRARLLVIMIVAGLGANSPAMAAEALPPGAFAPLLTDAMSSLYPLRTTSNGWAAPGSTSPSIIRGNLAVAQLMAAFRRSSRGSEPVGMRDGELRIPEHGNRRPDVLDEARYELDFLLTRVVPDGEPAAGMVMDTDGPSVAATLGFAAVAAAGGRYFARFDRAFIDRLKAAAIKAYAAAGAQAKSTDASLTDEFYWAAAELFITTGKPAYLADLKASPLWAGQIFTPAAFDWNNVGPFARLLLAREPTRLPSADAAAIRQSVLDGADVLLASRVETSTGQDWRSAFTAVNNALVLAAAYDISGRAKYREGALAVTAAILEGRHGTELAAGNDLSPDWNGALSQLAGWLNEL